MSDSSSDSDSLTSPRDFDLIFVSASEEEEEPTMSRKDSDELKALKKSREGVQESYLEVQAKIVGWDTTKVSVEEFEYTLSTLAEFLTDIKTLVKNTYEECETDEDWARHKPSLQSNREAIEKSYLEVKTHLNAKLAATTPTPPPAPAVTVTPFKEKVDIPTFDGTFSKWTAFHDLFVHKINVERINSGASRMALLLTKVTGDAAMVISSYSPTDANFTSAWKDLCNRYSNKKEIAFSHLKEFHSLKPQDESAAGIRKVLDTLRETTRSITNLGGPNTWDLLFIFLATKKLDVETKKWWALATKSEFPTLDEFTKFLENRAAALMQIPTTNHSSGSSKKSSSTHHANSTQYKKSCAICGSDDHTTSQCSELTSKTLQERRDIVQKSRLCFNCLKKGHGSKDCKSNSRCHNCQRKHHTLLHMETATTQASYNPAFTPHTPQPTAPPQPTAAGNHAFTSSSSVVSSYCAPVKDKELITLMGTLLVSVVDSKGQRQLCRVFVDSGSESHFITENCVSRLGLKRDKVCVSLTGIGGIKAPSSKGKVNIQLDSLTCDYSLEIAPLIMNKVTGLIPKTQCRGNWPHLLGLQLSDLNSFKPAQVDILLGGLKSGHIVLPQKVEDVSNPDAPVAWNTKFGWMVTGASPAVSVASNLVVRTHHVSCNRDSDDPLSNAMTQFWELEEPSPQPKPMSSNDVECEKHFLSTHSVNPDGSYTVELPFKTPTPELGNSKDAAQSRFRKLEAKLTREPSLKEVYAKYMKTYQDLGYMEEVPPEVLNTKNSESYYIPHHVVVNNNSTTTKHRVVFDASMKTTSGFSLNEVLHPGPKLQVDLHPLLIKFMSHNIAMSADIWKFYPQTHVHKKNQDFQRFLWRETSLEPVKVWRMTRLSFGLTCAPFLAIRALHQLADANSEQFPLATQTIKEDFLVDNLLSGAGSVEKALELQGQVSQVLNKGNLKLTKWTSNSPDVLKTIPRELLDTSVSLDISEGENQVVRTIGIMWKPKQDTFQVSVQLPEPNMVTTKRSVLSTIARTFDPLGWLSPVTVRPKILMQRIWAQQLDWDQPLPLSLHKEWQKYTEELPFLHQFQLNRNICQLPHPSSKNPTFELHGFSDGSDLAYSACVYVKVVDSEGRVSTNLVTAKTKVTPIKKQTTPRSELCGAVLLCNLMDTVKRALPNVTFSSFQCWSDSTVVLGRINVDKKLPIFELNRVIKIISLFPAQHWGHVRGEENPADCASRGISALELLNHPLWLHGPPWLRLPNPLNIKTESSGHTAVLIPPGKPSPHTFIENCSSFPKMRRVIAYCNRFITRARVHIPNSPKKYNLTAVNLTTDELNQAFITIVKLVQRESFPREMTLLKANARSIPSRFLALAPFLDQEGVLRVGGRLNNANIPYQSQHPALLPTKHNFVKAYIRFYHFKGLHAGPSLLLSLLRETVWIVAGIKPVKSVVQRCTICFRHSALPARQLMGQLPSSRVNPTHPFCQSGVVPSSCHFGPGGNPLK